MVTRVVARFIEHSSAVAVTAAFAQVVGLEVDDTAGRDRTEERTGQSEAHSIVAAAA